MTAGTFSAEIVDRVVDAVFPPEPCSRIVTFLAVFMTLTRRKFPPSPSSAWTN